MTPGREQTRGDRCDPRDRAPMPLDIAPVAHLTTDVRGRIQYADRASRTLLTSGRGCLRGRSLSAFLRPGMRDAFESRLRELRSHPRRELGCLGVHVETRSGRALSLAASSDHGRGPKGPTLLWMLRDDSELRDLRAELRSASVERLLAEEQVRARLSQDLHDDLGQLLALVTLKLAKLGDQLGSPFQEPVEEIADIVETIVRRATSLTFQLHPPMLESEGIVPAAEWLARELQRSYHLEVKLETSGDLVEGVDAVTRVMLFRSLRELLLNVAKHADASRAHARLTREGERIELRVHDDGRGARETSARSGFGLQSLGERCSALGGAFCVEQGDDGGTRATMILPVSSKSRLVSHETGAGPPQR